LCLPTLPSASSQHTHPRRPLKRPCPDVKAGLDCKKASIRGTGCNTRVRFEIKGLSPDDPELAYKCRDTGDTFVLGKRSPASRRFRALRHLCRKTRSCRAYAPEPKTTTAACAKPGQRRQEPQRAVRMGDSTECAGYSVPAPPSRPS